MCQVAEVPLGVSVDLEALPADVRQYRDFRRQRPAPEFEAMGTLDRESLQETLSGETNAGIASPRFETTALARPRAVTTWPFRGATA